MSANPYGRIAGSTSSVSRPLWFLRLTALLGTSIVLCRAPSSLPSIQPRQDWGFIVLMLAIPAVASACVLLLPSATGKLEQHLDLLLPLGLYITIMELLSTLTMIPVLAAVLAPSWSFTILSLSFSVSAAFLLLIAIAIAYAGWTTTLVLQAVREDRVDPIATLPTSADRSGGY